MCRIECFVRRMITLTIGILKTIWIIDCENVTYYFRISSKLFITLIKFKSYLKKNVTVRILRRIFPNFISTIATSLIPADFRDTNNTFAVSTNIGSYWRSFKTRVIHSQCPQIFNRSRELVYIEKIVNFVASSSRCSAGS